MTDELNLLDEVMSEGENHCVQSEMPYRDLAMEGLKLRALTQFEVGYDFDGEIYVNLGDDEDVCYMNINQAPVVRMLNLFAKANGMELCPCEMADLILHMHTFAEEIGDQIDPNTLEIIPEKAA